MKKKIIYIAITIVIVVSLGLGLYFLTKSAKIELDLQLLNQSLSQKSPFNEMATMDITTEELSTLLEINSQDVVNVIGKIPLMNVHASMYLVIEAKEDSVDIVEQKVAEYGALQETQWEMYLPEQYELVKQRKIGVVGNYVYLIISETANELEQVIIK